MTVGLRDILREIAEENGGRLTPPLVLAYARDPASPLHHRFEWEDTVAAEQWRLAQARALIQKVRVVYATGADGPKRVRAFHAVRAVDETEFNYEDVEDVMADAFKRKLVMREMERQIAELVARYEHFNEFWQQIRRLSRRKSKA